MKQFAEWLSTTGPSVFIQNNNTWAIPLIQSIHIVGIAVVFGSIFLILLRILGWVGMDQTLRQTTNRYGPWMTGSLWLLLTTGVLMVIGEPVRELVTVSFWLKMALIVVGTLIAAAFRVSMRTRVDEAPAGASTKALAVLTFLIWAGIIVLGRLIAYDQVWGSWSPTTA
jgi:putative copper export protein